MKRALYTLIVFISFVLLIGIIYGMEFLFISFCKIINIDPFELFVIIFTFILTLYTCYNFSLIIWKDSNNKYSKKSRLQQLKNHEKCKSLNEYLKRYKP
jgi:hypothetical protein